MGDYINPPDCEKEEWLSQHAEPIKDGAFFALDYAELEAEGRWPVALVDNGPFTAALICSTEQEWQYMYDVYKDDPRPVEYFTAPIDLLRPFCR